MTRSLYAMSIEDEVILERRFGAGLGAADLETLGRIEEASYLGQRSRSWWARLFGGRTSPCLLPPFDGAGADVHGLLAGVHPMLDGEDDPLGSIRLAQGTITLLHPREPSDEVVVRDAWSVERGVRVTSALHFGLVLPGFSPVAVAFAQSPLVIGKPVAATFAAALSDVPQPARAAFARTWPGLDPALPAQLIELREGDPVDVLGIVTTPEQCQGRFDLAGRTTNYREATSEVSLVVGDRQGLRMVLRKQPRVGLGSPRTNAPS